MRLVMAALVLGAVFLSLALQASEQILAQRATPIDWARCVEVWAPQEVAPHYACQPTLYDPLLGYPIP